MTNDTRHTLAILTKNYQDSSNQWQWYHCASRSMMYRQQTLKYARKLVKIWSIEINIEIGLRSNVVSVIVGNNSTWPFIEVGYWCFIRTLVVLEVLIISYSLIYYWWVFSSVTFVMWYKHKKNMTHKNNMNIERSFLWHRSYDMTETVTLIGNKHYTNLFFSAQVKVFIWYT